VGTLDSAGSDRVPRPGRFLEMTFGSLLLLALGLAMDATAVAAARGCATRRIRLRHVALVALLFGGFQAGMPLLGWGLGRQLGPTVKAWDHWIAFALLAAIGAKMLHEARGAAGGEPRRAGDPFAPKVLLLLALATSIDAFAVGITLPLLGAPFVLSLATIGVTTALLSALGLFAGQRFGAVLGRRLDALGGVALIGLGCVILFDHLGH
jgi:putative Mn2+ efflux pump MntP